MLNPSKPNEKHYHQRHNHLQNRPNSAEYNPNGNMTYDWKGIDAITYNHMNLPTRINFKVDQGEKFISYIYNALGQKVSKQVIHQSSTEQVNTLTEYLSGFQYVGGILQLFPTAEGYVSVTNGKDFEYVYNYTDHIGNVRLSYTMPKGSTVLSILEENHYYPFGMKHANYGEEKYDFVKQADGEGYVLIEAVERNKYQYKYNGKEWQDDMGLNVTAMDFRQYDNAIGRFSTVDPLAEFSHSYTPYKFGYNSPIKFGDPTGLIEQTGNYLAGWVNTGTTIFWDPEVNNQDDVNRLYNGKKFVYVPDNTIVIDSDGDRRKLQPDGHAPILLNDVVVKGKPKPKPKIFYGASVRIIPDFGSGSYFAGAINVSQKMWDNYQRDGLNSYSGRFMMHEYGHYLQNKHGGAVWYNMYPAVSSMVDLWSSNVQEHSQHWAEIQASTMSYYYFGYPKGFVEDDNIIMPNYISDELKVELYNGYMKHH